VNVSNHMLQKCELSVVRRYKMSYKQDPHSIIGHSTFYINMSRLQPWKMLSLFSCFSLRILVTNFQMAQNHKIVNSFD
jgi:hypothetical protein